MRRTPSSLVSVRPSGRPIARPDPGGRPAICVARSVQRTAGDVPNTINDLPATLWPGVAANLGCLTSLALEFLPSSMTLADSGQYRHNVAHGRDADTIRNSHPQNTFRRPTPGSRSAGSVSRRPDAEVDPRVRVGGPRRHCSRSQPPPAEARPRPFSCSRSGPVSLRCGPRTLHRSQVIPCRQSSTIWARLSISRRPAGWRGYRRRDGNRVTDWSGATRRSCRAGRADRSRGTVHHREATARVIRKAMRHEPTIDWLWRTRTPWLGSHQLGRDGNV